MIEKRLVQQRSGYNGRSITLIAVGRMNCQAGQHRAQEPCDNVGSRCDGTIHVSNDKTLLARLPAALFMGGIHTAVAFDYAVILSPWLGGWLVTTKRAGAVLRLIA
jgi:hypothetical protein